MSDVSDMLYEFYRVNSAVKAPKQQSVLGAAVTAKYRGQTSPTSAETHEPSSIAAIATNGSASATASKNLYKDEMVMTSQAVTATPSTTLTNTQLSQEGPSFHPCIKYTLNAKLESEMQPSLSMTAIPTSVVVMPTLASTSVAANGEPVDIKPIINPATGLVVVPNPAAFDPQSVIKPVPSVSAVNTQAAAIAAALLRDGIHNFQQQIRAQDIIKFQADNMKAFATKPMQVNNTPTNILQSFLKQQRNSECENDTNSDYNDGDDEDDSRYNGFDDIHLMESSKQNLPQLLQNVIANNSGAVTPGSSHESKKYITLATQAHAQVQAEAFRNLEYGLGDFGNTSPNGSANMGPTGIGADGESVFECRHCGKKYRWKSTLRRHETVECGGKEPSHQCPYCQYKSKQRGNLGVHVRKHHANMPQLMSKRRSKYSLKSDESNLSSANISDDSNSKLIIDCSK